MADLENDDSTTVDPNLGDTDNDSNSGGEPSKDTGDKPVSMEDTIRNRLKELRSAESGDGEQPNNPKLVSDAQKKVVPPTSQTPTDDYPGTWKKGYEEKWKALDPEIKAEVVRREQNMRDGIQTYQQAEHYAKTLYEKFAPYRALMQREGLKDDALLQNMLNTSYTLYTGTPEQKVMTLIQLAQQNGINLEGLVQSVSNLAAGKNAVDPQVLAIQQQLQQVQATQQQWSQAQVDQQAQAAHSTVTAFANEPANKYINEPGVRDLMATLVESGQAVSLQDAYNKAIGALPDVRTKLFAEQQADLDKQAAEKAAAARKASANNVTTRGKHTGGKVQKGVTMEDTIRNTLREINSRN